MGRSDADLVIVPHTSSETGLEIPTGIWVPGVPKPQGSMTPAGRGKVRHSSAALLKWRQDVAWTVRSHLHGHQVPLYPAGTPVTLHLTFYQRRVPVIPPDLDKLVRAILDALTGVLYVDDGQVVMIAARKQSVHAEGPGVRITWAVEH